jgi:hypothetical protein
VEVLFVEVLFVEVPGETFLMVTVLLGRRTMMMNWRRNCILRQVIFFNNINEKYNL